MISSAGVMKSAWRERPGGRASVGKVDTFGNVVCVEVESLTCFASEDGWVAK